MDGNYDINLMDFSLKSICGVRVVHRILLASRTGWMRFPCEMDAKRRIRELKLPRTLSEMLEALMRVVNTEMDAWYRLFRQYGDPVLSMHGTVDMARSAEAILSNKETGNVVRYTVACDFCIEERIVELFNKLNLGVPDSPIRLQIMKKSTPIVKFWTDALQRVTCNSKLLPQHAYDNGLEVAWRTYNGIAIRHFIDKASPRAVKRCMATLQRPDISSAFKQRLVSPATFCSMVSKLSAVEKRANIHTHSAILLLLLMDWPYQRHFVAAARSLAGHLLGRDFWDLLRKLVERMCCTAKDYDYRELFVELWLAGSCHMQHPRNDMFCEVVFGVVKLKDERLLDFVLTRSCRGEKEKLLIRHFESTVELSSICIYLLRGKQFRLLELFVRGCTTNDVDLLRRFKSELLSLRPGYEYPLESIFDGFWTKWEWEDGMRQFVETMDKILADEMVAEKICMMEGNYEIKSMAFSLKTLCAVKIVRQLLLRSAVPLMRDTIATDAKRRVGELELPRTLGQMVEELISSVSVEMNAWYRKYSQYGVDPVLTSQGTVDMVRSAQAILINERTSEVAQYEIACEHCFEEVILELFDKLKLGVPDASVHFKNLENCSPFVQFWTETLRRVNGSHIPQHACNEGFDLGWRYCNDIAIRHFIEKASPEVVQSCVDSYRYLAMTHNLFGITSPATFCLLVSKLPGEVQQARLHTHSLILLYMLLKWPYRRCFMETAHSLVGRLSGSHFWDVLRNIVWEIAEATTDYDHRGLFIEIWLAGSCHMQHPRHEMFVEVVFEVMLLKDDSLTDFVLTRTCRDDKERLLMRVNERLQLNGICMCLFHRKDFRLMEIFIRGCCMNNRRLLSTFLSKFEFMPNGYEVPIQFRMLTLTWTEDEWRTGLRRVVEIVDKIMAETRGAEETVV